jgi:DNA-binding MarR family transcriptional regulator
MTDVPTDPSGGLHVALEADTDETEDDRRQALADFRVALTELFAAERRMRGREKRRTGELTVTQSIALIPLYLGEEATAGDLANSAGLNPASVTAMLDQLENAGIVERRRSDSDRRVVLVSLTEKGRASQNAMKAQWDERWTEWMAEIPDEDLIVTLRTIQKVSRMLDAANS